MTTNDITTQMTGPSNAATRSTPAGEASCLLIHDQRLTMNRKTADQVKATPKCISTPRSAVGVPPSSAPGPTSSRGHALEQARHRRLVEEHAERAREQPVGDAGQQAGAEQARPGRARTIGDGG